MSHHHHQIKPDFSSSSMTEGSQDEQLEVLRSVLLDLQDSEDSLVLESSSRTLWLQFQSTASALTQLYRAGAPWAPFQAAAAALTTLYTDAGAQLKTVTTSSERRGYNRCRKHLINWAAAGGRRRYIRRDELISVIAALSGDGGGGPRPNSPGPFPAEQRSPSSTPPPPSNNNRQKRGHSSPDISMMDSPNAVWKKQRHN